MAGGIYGAAKLEQDADMTWFIHGDSYLQDFYKSEDRYFPSYGEDTAMYLGNENNNGNLGNENNNGNLGNKNNTGNLGNENNTGNLGNKNNTDNLGNRNN